MKHFAKELGDYLAGPPKQLAKDFADKCGIGKSKMSRILSDTIDIDRQTLDVILDGLPHEHHAARTRLVAAYIRDLVSPGAMLCLKPKGANEWANLDFSGLSPKGVAALKALLRSDHIGDVEKILMNLAAAFGLTP